MEPQKLMKKDLVQVKLNEWMQIEWINFAQRKIRQKYPNMELFEELLPAAFKPRSDGVSKLKG